jgi:hypothetical protein
MTHLTRRHPGRRPRNTGRDRRSVDLRWSRIAALHLTPRPLQAGGDPEATPSVGSRDHALHAIPGSAGFELHAQVLCAQAVLAAESSVAWRPARVPCGNNSKARGRADELLPLMPQEAARAQGLAVEPTSCCRMTASWSPAPPGRGGGALSSRAQQRRGGPPAGSLPCSSRASAEPTPMRAETNSDQKRRGAGVGAGRDAMSKGQSLPGET